MLCHNLYRTKLVLQGLHVFHLTQFIQFTKAEKKRVNQDSCIKHVRLFKATQEDLFKTRIFIATAGKVSQSHFKV